ncbi:MAG: gluconate 2-dehydrogenase subunit 3 family protein [Bdellovibrio sp.]|nr:gluconate 2-dehydrogenase subunit 3 family protein [Bdellovibrio sp.]
MANALAKTTNHGSANNEHPAHPAAGPKKNHYVFLQAHESTFLEAAVARLIPADEKWGGALEAGVVNYIDLQLQGSWGAGERLYRSGPWIAGEKTQGYQLPYTPSELFRTALRALDKDLKAKKLSFEKMTPVEQDQFLKKLETSDQDLDGVPAKTFFAQMYQMTIEGFFADPSYGGNKNMVSWRMIGFPGAFASYYDLVDKHGIKITRAPMSLAQDSGGHMHMQPNRTSSAGQAPKEGT